MSDTWLPDWRYYGICSRWQVEVLFMINWQCLFCCLFLLHLWTLCPEVSCYYFYYLRKYNDNPHKNNNTTNQTSNDTIQCQYSHTSCNSKIVRHKKHTHFSDTIGTSYQNPIKEIIKPLLYCKPPSFIKFLFSSHIRSCTGCWCFRDVLTRKDTLNAYSVLVSLWAGCFVFKVRVRSKKRFLH